MGPTKHRAGRRSRLWLAGLLIGGYAIDSGGWDLTRRLSESLPPAIFTEPSETIDATSVAKNGGLSLEDQVMELVNQERWTNGNLPPLKRDALLDTATESHSASMGSNDFFAHRDLVTCSWPWDRMTSAGYFWVAALENIAAGSSTAAGVMAQWMGSSGHRANILSTDVRELGIGYSHDPGDVGNIDMDSNNDCVADSFNNGPWYHYWTQNFGRRTNVYPVVIEREAYETDTRDVSLYLYGNGWADDMRIRNEVGDWTAWLSFASDMAWQLSGGAGDKEVFVEIRQGSTVLSASDTIVSTDDSGGDLIFEDGFESGDTSAWSAEVG